MRLQAVSLRTSFMRQGSSRSAVPMPDEPARIHDLIEALAVDYAGSNRRIAKGQILVVGGVSDRRGFVVPDDGGEGRDQHQRAADRLIDMLAIELRAFHRESSQLLAGIAEDTRGMQEV